METNRKQPYLDLLAHMILDIRSSTGPNQRLKWWSPRWWVRIWRASRRNFFLADGFHNLPYYLARDSFQEDIFWNEVKSCVPEDYDRYKSQFEIYCKQRKF